MWTGKIDDHSIKGLPLRITSSLLLTLLKKVNGQHNLWSQRDMRPLRSGAGIFSQIVLFTFRVTDHSIRRAIGCVNNSPAPFIFFYRSLSLVFYLHCFSNTLPSFLPRIQSPISSNRTQSPTLYSSHYLTDFFTLVNIVSWRPIIAIMPVKWTPENDHIVCLSGCLV